MLYTPRLMLRRFTTADMDAFVAYRADPEVARYQGWEAGFSRAQGEEFLEWVKSVDPDTPGEWFQFAIERRDAPGLIGDCAAHFGPTEVETVDGEHRLTLDLGTGSKTSAAALGHS